MFLRESVFCALDGYRRQTAPRFYNGDVSLAYKLFKLNCFASSWRNIKALIPSDTEAYQREGGGPGWAAVLSVLVACVLDCKR